MRVERNGVDLVEEAAKDGGRAVVLGGGALSLALARRAALTDSSSRDGDDEVAGEEVGTVEVDQILAPLDSRINR